MLLRWQESEGWGEKSNVEDAFVWGGVVIKWFKDGGWRWEWIERERGSSEPQRISSELCLISLSPSLDLPFYCFHRWSKIKNIGMSSKSSNKVVSIITGGQITSDYSSRTNDTVTDPTESMENTPSPLMRWQTVIHQFITAHHEVWP